MVSFPLGFRKLSFNYRFNQLREKHSKRTQQECEKTIYKRLSIFQLRLSFVDQQYSFQHTYIVIVPRDPNGIFKITIYIAKSSFFLLEISFLKRPKPLTLNRTRRLYEKVPWQIFFGWFFSFCVCRFFQ